MPKYWGKQIFSLGRFPKVGQKQKTERKKKKRKRPNDGNNSGQATHGAQKHAWRTQAAWANVMCRLPMLCYMSYIICHTLHVIFHQQFCLQK